MTVYNKPLFFIGTLIGALGVYIDNIYTEMWVPGVILMLLGAAMVVWCMKKPKNYKDIPND